MEVKGTQGKQVRAVGSAKCLFPTFTGRSPALPNSTDRMNGEEHKEDARLGCRQGRELGNIPKASS